MFSGEVLQDFTLFGRTIVVDCRWLGIGGPGRLTEELLSGLAEAPPGGRWLLWGEEGRLLSFAFPTATIVPARHGPRRFRGQADVLRVPSADLIVYMHQLRPLRPGRSITYVHDTIPLRYGGNALSRRAKLLFLRRVAGLSTRIVTGSEEARDAIARDLGVARTQIVVVPHRIDERRAAGVAELRGRLPHEDVLLYVGRFAEHKNLLRLCKAFAGSRFAASGGRLVLVGGDPNGTARISRRLVRERITGVELRAPCSEAELDRLLATSRALIAPALEEGYGLPALEALATGLPVASSRTGAAAQLRDAGVVLFDPSDIAGMRSAIDDVVGHAPGVPRQNPPGESFAAALIRVVADCLDGQRVAAS